MRRSLTKALNLEILKNNDFFYLQMHQMVFSFFFDLAIK